MISIRVAWFWVIVDKVAHIFSVMEFSTSFQGLTAIKNEEGS